MNLKFKILTNPSFRISTKLQLHNLYKRSAAKCWTNSDVKILPFFKFQNLDNPSCAQSLNKSLALWPKVSSQINKLLPTWSSASTSATITTSTSFELASSLARVTSIKFTKQEWVSEWVSQWVSESVSDKSYQWSDSGPIKNSQDDFDSECIGIDGSPDD